MSADSAARRRAPSPSAYPIINLLAPEDQAAILPYLREHEYAGGAVLLEQNQAAGRFHIVLSGVLDVIVEQGISVSVAKLDRGHFVGEMSCLTGEPVSATVVALGPARTVSMPRDGLLLLMDRSTAFRDRMIEAMVKRIGKSNERVMEERASSLIVMRQLELERKSQFGPLAGGSAFMRQLREQADRLAGESGPICIVGERGVGKVHLAYEIHRRASGGGSPLLRLDAAVFHGGDWALKAQAMGGGTLILEHADQLPSELLRRLIRSAERTRVILTAREAPDVRATVVNVIPLRERAEDIPELVREFLRQAGASELQQEISQEALRMIALFPFLKENVRELKQVVQHAFVRSGGKTILTSHLRFGGARAPGSRPTIGLALGSGSVRGAAHVGVLKVLEQEKIPVDVIAGTSVGAFIGALYAGGQPVSAFERVLPTVRWRQLVRPALLPRAFVNNHPMVRFVEKYIGPVHFEELSVPFAAVASDAVTGEGCILNQGRVSHAISASTAIPGLMKPVKHRGRTLIDGAVAHPVPVALAKSMGADIVIAVDVGAPSFAKGTPKNFVSSILHTIDIMSEKMMQEELQLADVVLNPHLNIHQISFKASPALIRVGEEVTREAVAAIKGKIAAAEGMARSGANS